MRSRRRHVCESYEGEGEGRGGEIGNERGREVRMKKVGLLLLLLLLSEWAY
jgi:hypothetical protein